MNRQSNSELTAQHSRWPAKLHLRFACDSAEPAAVTRMFRQPGYGPLYVQKPFYPEADVCHVYLLHPPGGITGGDHLSTAVEVEPRAQVLLTTPAATKFQRTSGGQAWQQQDFYVGKGAALEYLPQETIVLDGAQATNISHVRLHPQAHCVLMDVVSFGRPVIAERFARGRFRQRLQIDRWDPEQGTCTPWYIDEQTWSGGGPELTNAWGLQGNSVLGTLVAGPIDEDALRLLEQRQNSLRQGDGESIDDIHITLVNGIMIARVFGDGVGNGNDGGSTYAIAMRLRQLWALLRPLLVGRAAVPPKIWNT